MTKRNEPAGLERRFVTNTPVVEVRAEGEDDESRVIIGHAAVFNQEATIGRFFRERIAPGAFADAISRPDDVRALFNHDPNIVLGRNKAGTLRLSEDSDGLRYEIDPPDTTVARDLMVSLERGDVTQSSFGFRIEVEEWDESDEEALPLRTIIKAELFDVSPVTFPAYEGSDAGIRSEVDAEAAIRTLEERTAALQSERAAAEAQRRNDWLGVHRDEI